MTYTASETAVLLALCLGAFLVLFGPWLGRWWSERPTRRFIRDAWGLLNRLPSSWTVRDIEEARRLRLEIAEARERGLALLSEGVPPGLYDRVEEIMDRLRRHQEGLELQTRVLFQEANTLHPLPPDVEE